MLLVMVLLVDKSDDRDLVASAAMRHGDVVLLPARSCK